MSDYNVKTHAELCPVCKGTGIYEHYDNYIAATVSSKTTCHGCNGTGWVTVQDLFTTVSGG